MAALGSLPEGSWEATLAADATKTGKSDAGASLARSEVTDLHERCHDSALITYTLTYS